MKAATHGNRSTKYNQEESMPFFLYWSMRILSRYTRAVNSDMIIETTSQTTPDSRSLN